jgi:LacI family transcriptional regulator
MVVMDTTSRSGVPCIRLGVAAGMTAAVRRLIELGHRNIGYVRARPRCATFLARWHAFQRATSELRTHVVTAGLSVADAERLGSELLGTTADRVTAVVCDDDLQAAGVYRAAHALGIRIPDDLSVVGFGNTAISQLLFPDLTTVELHGEELGRTGLITLLELIEGKRPTSRLMLGTALLERGSTAGPPPGHGHAEVTSRSGGNAAIGPRVDSAPPDGSIR